MTYHIKIYFSSSVLLRFPWDMLNFRLFSTPFNFLQTTLNLAPRGLTNRISIFAGCNRNKIGNHTALPNKYSMAVSATIYFKFSRHFFDFSKYISSTRSW